MPEGMQFLEKVNNNEKSSKSTENQSTFNGNIL